MKSTRFVLALLLLATMAAVSTPATAQINQSFPANWALDRIDQRNGPINHNYGYTTTGAGVHVYIVDSGIRTDHSEFAGRLTVDKDYVFPTTGGGSDCYGHGTAVAGIAAGSTYGVAKGAQIHVLRVIGCTPPANESAEQAALRAAAEVSNFVQALEWIRVNHVKPAVVNISANYKESTSSQFANAVTALLEAGVVVVTSAGNAPGPIDKSWQMSSTECQNSFPQYLPAPCPCDTPYYDACTLSPSIPLDLPNVPARVPGVVTVGATRYYNLAGQWDRRSKQTHWGVDVYAPGWQLYTASIGSPTATQLFDNTSAAAPVVTGVVARYLQSHPTATPAQVRTWVKTNATMQTLTHAPQWEAGVVYMAPTE